MERKRLAEPSPIPEPFRTSAPSSRRGRRMRRVRSKGYNWPRELNGAPRIEAIFDEGHRVLIRWPPLASLPSSVTAGTSILTPISSFPPSYECSLIVCFCSLNVCFVVICILDWTNDRQPVAAARCTTARMIAPGAKIANQRAIPVRVRRRNASQPAMARSSTGAVFGRWARR